MSFVSAPPTDLPEHGVISGCIVVGDITLCYKKLGDILDWETLRDLLTALKQIDDRVRAWLDIINEDLSEEL